MLPTNVTPIQTSAKPEHYIASAALQRGANVLSVSGPSGSGKTTFAKALATALGSERCLILKVDHYWQYTRAEMAERGLTGYDWQTRDKRRFLRDLTALKSGRSIEKPTFDYTLERPANRTETVYPKEIIILEDTLDFTKQSELSVFTYAPDPVLIARRLKRDRYKKGFQNQEELAEYIEKKSLPAYRAQLLPIAAKVDFIVDTDQSVLYEVRR